MNFDEQLTAICEHGADPDAARVRLRQLVNTDAGQDKFVSPWLDVYVGPGVGVLTYTYENQTFRSSGGINTESVVYRTDEWVSRLHPVGAEIPIRGIIEAVRKFENTPERPTNIQWERYDPSDLSNMIFDDDEE